MRALAVSDDSNACADDVIAWLRHYECEPLDETVVPGTNVQERRHLAALGGIAAALVSAAPSRRRDDPDVWPSDVGAWLRAVEPPPGDLSDRVIDAVLSDTGILGSLYARVVTGRNRRRLGTFFTPPALVRHMVTLTERVAGEPPSCVVDPGAGVGAFSVVAASRWDARVIAVDINVVTLGLLGAASALHDIPMTNGFTQPQGHRRHMVLVHSDFLAWVHEGLRAEQSPLLVLGNPPYTRHQGLGEQTKRVARLAAGDLVPSGLAGMSSYFLAAALRYMRREDSLCLLLPSNWLDTHYGRELRRFLWSVRSRRVEIHVFPSELEVFPGTQVSAVVLALGPTEAEPQPFVVGRAHLSLETVTLEGSTEHDRSGSPPDTFAKLVPRERTAPVPLLLHGTGSPKSHGVALADIAIVRRGVATGANDVFFLNDAGRRELPDGAYVRALVRARYLQTDVLDEEAHDGLEEISARRWLLDFHAYRHTSRVELPRELRRLLDAAERAGMTERRLIAMRDPWWVVETVKPAPILVSPMTKSTFRVIENPVGAVHSNTLYGITPLASSELDPALLAGWLRGPTAQARLVGLSRQHATGLFKIEPRSLGALRVPLDDLNRS